MKIVVIGGSGLIGKKVVQNLRAKGHEVLPASPSTGVDTLTGEVLSGPPPRPLGRIEVEIRDDVIWAVGYRP